jgi:cysteine synthase A
MTELIGNTPLVRLRNLDVPAQISLYAKLEFYNPGGSVKDRTGIYMLEAAERSGQLRPGGTIVEATAGNMGLGLAMAALGRGYRIIFVVPSKFSTEKQTLLRALGAEVINTPRAGGMLGACRKAAEILQEIPGAISLLQFENPANPQAHYATTGPEIWQALDGRIDWFVAGAGSGGTYSGVVRFLKEQDPAIKGTLADPAGSTMGGGEHHDYDIEGIGNDFIPATMDMGLVDQVIKVADADALYTAKRLALHEGIIAGTSSGAAVWAALELAKRLGEAPASIVTVLPDRGDRYFSKGIFE